MPNEWTSARDEHAARPGDRLESWKAIAGYLERDVRTVQRWERSEGMPVHRHRHDQQASVYAFRSELDDWQRSRAMSLRAREDGELDAPPAAVPVAFDARAPLDVAEAGRAVARPRRPLWALAVASVTVLTAVLVWAARGPQQAIVGPSRPAVLLLGDVTGAAGRRASLEAAIRASWRTAGGIMPSGERVASALSLMRASGGGALAPGMALPLAERLGDVDAVAHVSVSGTSPALALEVVAWAGDASGRELYRRRDQAASEMELTADLAAAITALASIASAAPDASRAPPPAVTTASSAALLQFSEADTLMRQGSWNAAAALLEEAVARDPDFASAYAHLAWARFNVRMPRVTWETALTRAEALAAGVSGTEQAFIAGTALHLRGDVAGAARHWGRVLQAEPEHYWALGNLARARSAAGDHAAAERLVRMRASAHPASLISQMVAAEADTRAGRVAAAAMRLDDVVVQLPLAASAERSAVEPWALLAQACQAWQRGDVMQMRLATDRAAARLEGERRAGSPHDRYTVGLAYLGLGLPERAASVIARAAGHEEHDQMLAMVAIARGAPQEARDRLRGFASFAQPAPAVAALLPEIGLHDEARDVLGRWDRERFWPETVIAPLRAQVLVHQGRRAEAVAVIANVDGPLAQADLWINDMPTAGLLRPLARRLHARWLVAAGREGEALALLTSAAAERARACTARTFGTWQQNLLAADLATMRARLGGRATVDGAGAADLSVPGRTHRDP